MFSSRYLLTKKGPLGAIWVAAYFHKKLKKSQISQTDIPFSVDKMLQDEFDVVTYRVLAYLLLGLVRIYSKKVEYLFDDCHEVLSKINDFISNKGNALVDSLNAPSYSITLPDRFELDAFDLGILEEFNGGNVMPQEAITLKDIAWKSKGIVQFSLDKYQFELIADSQDTCFVDQTPAEDVLSSHMMDIDMEVGTSKNLSNLEASIEKLRENRFTQQVCWNLEKVYGIEKEPPVISEPFGEDHQTDEEEIDFSKIAELGAQSRMELSMEEFGECSFSPEVCLDHDTFSGFNEEPPEPVKPFGVEHQNDEGQIKIPPVALQESDTRKDHQLDVTPLFPDPSGATTPKFTVLPTPTATESDRKRKRKCVNTMPQFNPGATKPKFKVLPTPTATEYGRKRKKKCVIDDDPLVLPNRVLKHSIDDPSDLVSKRRKVPYNALAAWKAHRIPNLPKSFLEPLVTCAAIELRLLFCKNTLEIPESIEVVEAPQKFQEYVETVEASQKIPEAIETAEAPGKIPEPVEITEPPENILEAVETVEAPGRLNVSESPLIGRLMEETPIAPGTPTRASALVRSLESPKISYSEVGRHASLFEDTVNDTGLSCSKESYSDVGRRASLFEDTVNDTGLSENQELDINLMNEEINSGYRENQEPDGSSGSGGTSISARYLHTSFLNRSTEEETVNLSQVLQGKQKRHSARLFYEVLALKTGGYVDVNQDSPYADIHVWKLPKWEQTCGAHDK